MASLHHQTYYVPLFILQNSLLVSAHQLWARDDSILPGACSSISFALSFCESASPGFDDYAPASQAPCLCYSSTSWDPEAFDGAIATCADYFSTADPEALPTIEVFEGFCSSIGPVLGAAATSGAAASTGAAAASSTPFLTPTPAPSASKHIASATFASASPTFDLATATLTDGPDATALPDACTLIVSAISYCNEITPGFTSLDPTNQAPCLCYSSTSWDPQFFDDNVATCAGFLSTADATDVSIVSPFSSFCESVGDIRTVEITSGVKSFSFDGGVNNSPTPQGPVFTTVTPTPLNKPTPSPVSSAVSPQKAAARSNRVDWTLLGLLGPLLLY